MKSLGLVLLLLICSALTLPSDDSILRHHFIVQPSSRLSIFGKTNVNSFQCATQYCGRDTLILQEGGKMKPIFVKGYVGLEAASFDCGMALMTSDFAKTIKAKEYPLIGIEFKSFERLPTYACVEEKFKGVMAIHLSGVSKLFDVDCTMETKSTGLVHLKGSRQFKFGDFGLVPPKRMMGMVAVQEDLEVRFHLVLRLDPDLY